MSGLLVLGALLALLAAAWAVAFGAGATELDRADARLASEVRAAAAGFSGLVGVADARAGSLAASPALQRAVLRRDRAAIRRALILKTISLTLVGLISVGLAVAWLTSFKHNRDLIQQNEQADEEYALDAEDTFETTSSVHRG